jgi:hypothetical protein
MKLIGCRLKANQQQIDLLKTWIRQGARAPADEEPAEDPRRHWAYQRPVLPPVPQVRTSAWVRNPIDAFIAAQYEQRGLTPAAAADKAVLLRRVFVDLIGLPPTREEVQEFLADPADNAYERVVDRLLASPRYAERWGRHWMDIWRYSDWYGSRFINELRNSRRHIWRWRDWIIESLDKDKGYDRMILEMLAGDELAPGDLDVQRAGGYLGRNFYVFNRHVWLQETVEYTATAMLGITMKCCRCHDHKYDPIAQEDYYRFRAFFEPHQVRIDPLPGKKELLKANVAMGSPPGSAFKDGLDCVYDADPAAVTYLLERGNDKNPVKDRPIKPGVPAVIAAGDLSIKPITLPIDAFYPDLRPVMRQAMIAEAQAAVAKAEADLHFVRLGEIRLSASQARLASLEARIAAELAKYAQPADPRAQQLAFAAGQAERAATVAEAQVEAAQAQQDLVAAKAALKPKNDKTASAVADAENRLAAMRAKLAAAEKVAAERTASYTPLGPVYPRTSSGRRLVLARWIAGGDNPLTARVAVNHIWLRHMGSALVPSVSNFGLNGKRPTHPELLDWLAVEFMDHNWSMKALHRLIVTSNVYRLASEQARSHSPNWAVDPENRSLWRANVRRMEAEVVRDSLLYLAGRLDTTRSGEDLDPTTDDIVRRRSLYFRHTPDEKPLLLDVFDGANPSECFERTESIVPQQALALANSAFSQAQARLIARRLAHGTDGRALTDAEYVRAAFEHVLARAPTADEQTRCESFIQRQSQLLANARALTPSGSAAGPSAVSPSPDPPLRARENLVHVLLNYNEFVTIR